jgi:hypothetical protein
MNAKTAGNNDMELADKDANSDASPHEEPHTHDLGEDCALETDVRTVYLD